MYLAFCFLTRNMYFYVSKYVSPHEFFQACCVLERPCMLCWTSRFVLSIYLGCFRFIAVIKQASVNTPTHTSLLPCLLISHGSCSPPPGPRILAVSLWDHRYDQLAVDDPVSKEAIFSLILRCGLSFYHAELPRDRRARGRWSRMSQYPMCL